MPKKPTEYDAAIVEDIPDQFLRIPFPAITIRQRGINTTHGTVELRAHCTQREFDYITETAELLRMPRASLVRWLVTKGSQAVRKLLDGKDHDPNPV